MSADFRLVKIAVAILRIEKRALLLFAVVWLRNRLFLIMQIERQTFSKDERLKSRKLIGNLFNKGKIIHHFPFKVLYEFTDSSDFVFPAKMAVSVSKRNFKRAVDRNHIKRKIREAYRLNKKDLYNTLKKNDQKLYFFVIYTAKQDIDYQKLEEEMKLLIQKISDKL